MERSKGIIAASAIGAVIVIGGILYLLAPNVISASLPSATKNSNSTTIATSDQTPEILLIVLQGDEDSSKPVAQYEANNTEPIPLVSGSHIRFDSRDYRTAEGMKVIARNVDGGTIELLRKSYDVNNEFFINIGKGHYELQVQASWFEKGSFVYGFDVKIV